MKQVKKQAVAFIYFTPEIPKIKTKRHETCLLLSYRITFELVLQQKTIAKLLQRKNTMRNKAEDVIEILKPGMF